MADIVDLDRWQALRVAYANATDASPSFRLLQEAHGRASRARADLEGLQNARRGRPARPATSWPASTFERGVAELTQRVEVAASEVQRIDALQRTAGARRSALQQLVDGVRRWASQQSPAITLPGDGDGMTVSGLTGFAASTMHIATSPGREFAPSVAPRQGRRHLSCGRAAGTARATRHQRRSSYDVEGLAMTITELDTEIGRLQREASAVERAPYLR